MRFKGLTIFVLVIVLSLLLGSACSRQPNKTTVGSISQSAPVDINVDSEVKVKLPVVEPTAPNIVPIKEQHKITILPVPFTSQAPFANWDLPYQEACEEASMIMAAEYFKGNKKLQLDPTYADQEILKLVEWETSNGFTQDITAQEVATVLKNYYALEASVVQYNPRVIKEAILEHKLVLLPAAGRLLGNPYFRRPGPVYHMLVVKGFEDNEFITNDPGTRRGENFRYNELILARAVHDWNNGKVEEGQQVIIIVNKVK
jgi:hypothetical protein